MFPFRFPNSCAVLVTFTSTLWALSSESLRLHSRHYTFFSNFVW